MSKTFSMTAILAGFALIGLSACNQNETPDPVTDIETPPVDMPTGEIEVPTETETATGAGEVHEHGKGELAITLDGATLTVSLEAPLASFASFEHEPETPEQRQELQDVRAGFMRVSRNVAINGQAGCEFNTREVGFRHTGDHGSVMVDYAFECTTPDALTSVRLRTFDDYPGLESVDAVFLDGTDQKAKSLTAEDNSIWVE